MNPEETDRTRTTPEEPHTPTLLPDPAEHAPAEPLDDGGFTPPHGDPLGEAALDLPDAAVSPSEAPEPLAFEAENVTRLESATTQPLAAEVPADAAAPQPELLYSGPVEPAPAGSIFPNLEPKVETLDEPLFAAAGEATANTSSTGWEPAQVEPIPQAEAALSNPAEEPVETDSAQPEVLYAGPVEPAPAGLHFPGGDKASDSGAVEDRGGTPFYPSPEPHDELEAAALASEAADETPVVEPDEPTDTGPNWMLAFICAWSSAISLREAWATVGGGGLGMALRNLGVMGYLLLGVGLLAFAFDALRWGRPRRGVGPLVIPTLLTLAGVVCLVLWNDRGRPI